MVRFSMIIRPSGGVYLAESTANGGSLHTYYPTNIDRFIDTLYRYFPMLVDGGPVLASLKGDHFYRLQDAPISEARAADLIAELDSCEE